MNLIPATRRLLTAVLSTALLVTAGDATEPILKLIINPSDTQMIDDALEHGFNVLEFQAAHPTPDDPSGGRDIKGFVQYVHDRGYHVSGKRPAWFTVRHSQGRVNCQNEDGEPWGHRKGYAVMPCTASEFTAEAYRRGTVNALGYLELDHMRLFDEATSTACHHHSKTAFPAYLAGKGYAPGDFSRAWAEWADVPVPTVASVDANPALGMRKLEYEYRLWKEDNFLRAMGGACAAAKTEFPEARMNIGIISPLALYTGSDACIPLHRFREVKGADYIEIDFYDSTYGGGLLGPESFYIVEAANQMATDISGLPLLVTRNARSPGRGGKRSEGYFRILHLATMLLNDNVLGTNCYAWGIRIADEEHCFRKGAPRLTWFADAMRRIKQAYPLLQEFDERNRILIVMDDWIHSGRGIMKHRGTATYWRRMPRMPRALRPYKMVARIHRDADFATPRTLSRVDHNDYDIVFVNAHHCPETEFRRLVSWAKRGGTLLLYTERAFALDELRTERRPQRLKTLESLSSAMPLPTEVERFQELVEGRLGAKLFTPDTLFANVDIDAQTNPKGERLFVLTNYNTVSQDISFTFDAPWSVCQQIFDSADVGTSRDGAITHVRVHLPAQDAEIVIFRR
ncbi:MAG: hypothetical protein HN742_07570 [Lentisphaerae bacterium]|jgi:hypothetical protein|nr:hypothetical protein [Lentisphaerota bacterium]MBT5609406.1 hypothetical protein [Lentisphaerota bacterium]MBT7060217.1 hypothetical protein [Lentisphaerota bacterium]MBT7841714.1 hypothetical protein [Lentisphaerota bacterium]